MSYTFLEHTADVKFLAEGKTLEEVFIESSMALKESICGKITVLEQEKKEIQIKGESMENLLYKFLEEFIFLLDSENFLVSKVEALSIDQNSFILNATILGDKADHYKFTNDVKAITYNDMFIKQAENQNWQAQVVLDV